MSWLGWRLLKRRKIIVSLKQGGAIRGLLFRRRGQLVFLRDAEFLSEAQPDVPNRMKGEVMVERSEILCWQNLSA